MHPLLKLLQRQLYSFLGSWLGCCIVICGIFAVVIVSINSFAGNHYKLRGPQRYETDIDFSDNIGNINLERYLAYGPIDAVYSWVNGSDPVWAAKKSYWAARRFTTNMSSSYNHTNSDDTISHNRFRDSEELRYSLRSLEKNAPWLRHVYIVTDNQIPYWLNVENKRIRVISHADIFPNKSDLPVFSSPAIESHLHRIPGLSKKFIYFNDDVFLGAPTLPEDFYSLSGAQRLYTAWDVPKCAPGCSDSWIGDGYCDKACNVSACNFDFPDCVNATTTSSRGARGSAMNSNNKESFFCAAGCPDSWLGDKVCDAKCKSAQCGWDAGDCGVELVVEDFGGTTLLTRGGWNVSVLKQHGHESLRVGDWSGTPTLSSEEEYIPVAASVPYGSYAAYFNLSYFPCEALSFHSQPVAGFNSARYSYSAAFSPTCDESNIVSPFGPLGGGSAYARTRSSEVPKWTNFSYVSVEYSVAFSGLHNATSSGSNGSNTDPPPLVSYSALLLKHNMLIVLLRGHDSEFAPLDSLSPPTQPVDIRFTVKGYNVLTGINVTALFALRITPPEPPKPDLSIPKGMKAIEGYTASCIDMQAAEDNSAAGIVYVDKTAHLKQPFRVKAVRRDSRLFSNDSAHWNQGIVLSVAALPLSYSMFSMNISQVRALSTVTLLNGTRLVHEAPLCEVLAKVDHSTNGRVVHRTHLKERHVCDPSVKFGEVMNPSGQQLLDDKNEPVLILLHVPIQWHLAPTNDSGVGHYLYAKLELFADDSDSLNSDQATRDRVMCVGGLYRWGENRALQTRNISLIHSNNTVALNVSNETSSINATNDVTSKKNETKKIGDSVTDEPPKVDTYASSLRHVNQLYHEAFGAENRKVPAHMPHMIDKDVMEEMQQRWKDEWVKTSKHRFRSPTDMQYAFAYYYYVINRNKAILPDILRFISIEVDTDGDGFLSENELLTLASMVYRRSPTENDFEELRNCTFANYTSTHDDTALGANDNRGGVMSNETMKDVATIHSRKSEEYGVYDITYTLRRAPAIEGVANCSIVREGLLKHINWPATHHLESDKEVAFEMIGDNITATMHQLNSIRHRKTKFVCVNDQMNDPSPELQNALRDFFLAFFPFPSQFELKDGRMNPTLYYDEYVKLHSPKSSVSNRARYDYYIMRDLLVDMAHQSVKVVRESVRYVHEWFEGDAHPKTALKHWATGAPPPPPGGLRVFIPYWVLCCSLVGLGGLWCVRRSVRTRRRSVIEKTQQHIHQQREDPCQVESTVNLTDSPTTRLKSASDADIPLVKSAAIDFDRRRYYQSRTSSAENDAMDTTGDNVGEEERRGDLLNQLWRTAGYGSTAASSGRKSPLLAKHLKEHNSSDDVPASDPTKNSNRQQYYPDDDDTYSISTLGMEGWEAELKPTEEGRAYSSDRITQTTRKKKTVRWGGVSTVGGKNDSVSKMFRGFKDIMNESLKKNS